MIRISKKYNQPFFVEETPDDQVVGKDDFNLGYKRQISSVFNLKEMIYILKRHYGDQLPESGRAGIDNQPIGSD